MLIPATVKKHNASYIRQRMLIELYNKEYLYKTQIVKKIDCSQDAVHQATRILHERGSIEVNKTPGKFLIRLSPKGRKQAEFLLEYGRI